MAEADMREVVHRLHSEDSQAVLELLEFDYALESFLYCLETHTAASQELYISLRNLAANDGESADRISAVQDQAGRLKANAAQILAAFRAMRDGVAGWNIAATRRPSSQPQGRTTSLPPGAP
jgi:hypothetical protein